MSDNHPEIGKLSDDDLALVTLRELHGPLVQNYPLCFPMPAPNSHIYISTPSVTLDGPGQFAVMRNPEVSKMLQSGENKYTLASGARWNALQTKWTMGALEELRSGQQYLNAMPWRTLRVKDDASPEGWRFIGECSVSRWGFIDTPEPERKRLHKENEEKKAGDPTIIWEVGFVLDPEFQRKSLIPTVLSFLLKTYIPKLNIHQMRSACIAGNVPSRRVHEKVGFQFLGEPDIPLKEGDEKNWIFEWTPPREEGIL